MAWQPDPVDPSFDMYASLKEDAPFLVDYAVVWNIFCPKIIGLPFQEYGELRMGFSYGMQQYGTSVHNAAVRGSECDMNYRFRVAGRIMSVIGQVPNPSVLNVHLSQFLSGDRYKTIFKTDINICDFMSFNDLGQVHDEGWLPVTFAENKFKLCTGNMYLIVEGQLGQAEVFRNNHLIYSWDCTTGQCVDLRLLRGQLPLAEMHALLRATKPVRSLKAEAKREELLLKAKRSSSPYPTLSTLDATRVNANPQIQQTRYGRSLSLNAGRSPGTPRESSTRPRSLSYASRPHTPALRSHTHVLPLSAATSALPSPAHFTTYGMAAAPVMPTFAAPMSSITLPASTPTMYSMGGATPVVPAAPTLPYAQTSFFPTGANATTMLPTAAPAALASPPMTMAHAYTPAFQSFAIPATSYYPAAAAAAATAPYSFYGQPAPSMYAANPFHATGFYSPVYRPL